MRRFERSLARGGCERGDFRVAHYAIMGNHAHFIVEAVDAEALGRGMKSLVRRLVLSVHAVFSRRGAVLADRYHLRILRTPLEVRRAIAYVLLNARRHARRQRPEARIDPASSGRWFDGWVRGQARGGAGPPAVARPHTWLLGVGWRCHGLIDAAEVPG